MTVTSDPEGLFSARFGSYAQFIGLMRYPQGLRAFFNTCPLLRSDMRVRVSAIVARVREMATSAASMSVPARSISFRL